MMSYSEYMHILCYKDEIDLESLTTVLGEYMDLVEDLRSKEPSDSPKNTYLTRELEILLGIIAQAKWKTTESRK